jgi:hypothetical protein
MDDVRLSDSCRFLQEEIEPRRHKEHEAARSTLCCFVFFVPSWLKIN